MDANEFLNEMYEGDFPAELGREIGKGEHDPPFTQKELIAMSSLGLIVLDRKTWTFQLTMKATRMKDGGCK